MYNYMNSKWGTFFMELMTQNILQINEKIREYAQITFDDDYVIRDNKPDVAKIVAINSALVTDEIKCLKDALWIEGKVLFEALYRSDGRSMEPESLQGEVLFQEKIPLDGLCENDHVKVHLDIEDIAFTVINSRKLSLRGVINLEIIAEEQLDTNVTYGVKPEDEFEQQKNMVNILRLQCNLKDIIRIKNEITIPKSKPNIQRIIYGFVDVRNKEYYFQGKEFIVSGEMHFSILYMSEEGGNEWYEDMIPLNGKVSCDKAYEPDVFAGRVQLTQQNIEPQYDYDKEMRQISLELVFDVEVKAWKEEETMILKDIYSTRSNIKPVYKKLTTEHLLMKNVAKNRLCEQFSLEQNEEKIMQICASRGKAKVDSVELNENGLWVEGFLEIEILYITANDGFPIAHLTKQIPFEQQVEVPGIVQGDVYEVKSGCDLLAVSLLDNTEYEVKGTVSLEVLVLRRDVISVINDVEVEEEVVEKDSNEGGIVGYIVKKGESLWDIAKEYHTSMDEIARINNLSSKEVSEGDKLLIVKSII